MTIDIDTYERRKARLQAALRDAQARGDGALEEDVQDELVELENEMNRLTTDEKEEAAQKQLQVLHEVLKELREKSGMLYENPQKYYWLVQGDYIKHEDYYDRLAVWSSGCRGDRDTRECDWPYEVETDLVKFRAFIRAEALPLFNELRKNKRLSLERGIEESKKQIAVLQGEID